MSGISFDKVSKHFPNGVKALDDVSFEIDDGEFVVLVGPSGCGKSTLLRSVAGLERVTSGSIFIGDRDVTHASPRDRDIAMVFQSYALYPHLTVADNIGFGLRLRGADKPRIKRRVGEVASTLALDELLERKPAQLSGGQRQRVAMGRAIAREPAAYLMDEPLSNLDAKLRVQMRAELAELHQRLGVTTVFVTHDQVEAMTLGQRVALMRDGVLLQFDTPRAVYERPNDMFVASFVGSPTMNFVHAELLDGRVVFGGTTLDVPAHALPDPTPATFVLGIRPHSFALAGDGDTRPSLGVRATVVEMLGSESFVHFDLPVAPVAAPGAGAGDGDGLLADSHTRFVARVDARVDARPGDALTLAIDPAELYYFDARTHVRLPRRDEARDGKHLAVGV